MVDKKLIENQRTKKLFLFRWWLNLPFAVISFLISKNFNETSRMGGDLSALFAILSIVLLVIGLNDIFHRNKKHTSFKLTK